MKHTSYLLIFISLSFSSLFGDDDLAEGPRKFLSVKVASDFC